LVIEVGSNFELFYVTNTDSHFYVASGYNCGDIHDFPESTFLILPYLLGE